MKTQHEQFSNIHNTAMGKALERGNGDPDREFRIYARLMRRNGYSVSASDRDLFAGPPRPHKGNWWDRHWREHTDAQIKANLVAIVSGDMTIRGAHLREIRAALPALRKRVARQSPTLTELASQAESIIRPQ